MKSEGHFFVSLAKSLIRIAGATLALILFADIHLAFGVFASSCGLAEVLGVVEELVDKRG